LDWRVLTTRDHQHFLYSKGTKTRPASCVGIGRERWLARLARPGVGDERHYGRRVAGLIYDGLAAAVPEMAKTAYNEGDRDRRGRCYADMADAVPIGR